MSRRFLLRISSASAAGAAVPPPTTETWSERKIKTSLFAALFTKCLATDSVLEGCVAVLWTALGLWSDLCGPWSGWPRPRGASRSRRRRSGRGGRRGSRGGRSCRRGRSACRPRGGVRMTTRRSSRRTRRDQEGIFVFPHLCLTLVLLQLFRKK